MQLQRRTEVRAAGRFVSGMLQFARNGEAMNESDARKFLVDVREGRFSLDKGFEKLRQLPFEDLGFAKIDHHRSLRQGYSEVIYGRGKTPQQVAEIVRGMLRAKATLPPPP